MTDQENGAKKKQLTLGTEEKESNEKKQEKLDNSTEMNHPKQRFSLSYQQTEKEKELFKRLAVILSLLAVAIFITLYFISPFSKVGKIVVSGVEKSDATAVVESSQLRVGKSLWEQYFDRNESSKNIVKSNPRVETAKIQLMNMNTLQIKITEYKTIGYVEKNSKQYEVLANGKLLEQETIEQKEGLPLLINFDEGENLTEFIKAYEQMSDGVKENIAKIESIATQTNPFRIKFEMKDGNEVIGLSTTIADKMAFYDKIVAEMKYKGTIDMEAGTSGVFSSPFETETSSETENLETE